MLKDLEVKTPILARPAVNSGSPSGGHVFRTLAADSFQRAACNLFVSIFRAARVMRTN